MPADAASEPQHDRERAANADTIECWNERLTPKWVRYRHLLSGNGRIHSDLAWPRLDVRRGQRVLDVACGFGETTLEFADRVGPVGSVLGLDCTQAFLEIAERERHLCGVRNVEYRNEDIELAALPAHSFDVAASRFGIMFCANPERALRAIARALAPGGEIGLITWRGLAHNPCWALAEEVALRHLRPSGDQAQASGTGPFALSDRATDERIMAASGFVDVSLTQIDAPVCVGRTLDEAVEYQMGVGPGGFVIREAGAVEPHAAAAIRSDLRDALRKHCRMDGQVWLDSSTWFIRGRTAGE